MATKDYLPKTDAGLLAYTTNFSTIINLEPVALGISVAIASDYATKQAAFATALAAATNEGTRGKRTIFLKDEARKVLVKLTRQLVQQIGKTMSVTNDQRQQLQIPIPKGTRTPQPAPEIAPVASVVSTDGRNVTLELRQTRTRRGKPDGVATAMIFLASTETGLSAPPVGDPAWQFALNTSQTTVEVPCGTSATGDTVHFIAFWCNAKAESGPVSKAVSVALPAGGVLPQAEAKLKLRAA
ncbi:MAG: hypothetical protein QM754_08180 [Tepidisphaeraceae bacterium]